MECTLHVALSWPHCNVVSGVLYSLFAGKLPLALRISSCGIWDASHILGSPLNYGCTFKIGCLLKMWIFLNVIRISRVLNIFRLASASRDAEPSGLVLGKRGPGSTKPFHYK